MEDVFSETLNTAGGKTEQHKNCPLCGLPALPEKDMRLLDIQQIGVELAIKWDDGTETFIALEKMRRACPCAGCMGERDIMGQLHKGPDKPLSPRSFQLSRIELVGGYAVQPIWADGHSSGIFSFDYLRRLTE